MTHKWPVTVHDDAGKRVLVFDFTTRIGALKADAFVPRNFRHFDGASIPKYLWTAMGHPFMPKYERAAVVHDYLYKTPAARRHPPYDDILAKVDQGLEKNRRGDVREQIDELFYMMLLQHGVRPGRARNMRWGVRTYGSKHNRFWTHGGEDHELTLEEEIELGREIQRDIQALLGTKTTPQGFLGGRQVERDNDELDDEMLADLRLYDWEHIDPSRMEL